MKRGNDLLSPSSDVSPPKFNKIDKHGSSGSVVKMEANFFPMRQDEGFTLGQYRIDFEPDSEVTAIRKTMLRENIDVIGLGRHTFDGASLYTAKPLPEQVYEGMYNGSLLKISIRRTGTIQNDNDQAYQILNLIMRDAMAKLRLQNIKRNYYDPIAKIEIPEYNLELWPGYLTSIRTYENGQILLCAEIVHKFLRKETIMDIAKSVMPNNNWQELLSKEVIGTTVMTPYSNKTYNIDDIDYGKTPTSTFKTTRGEEQSFMDYYKNKYQVMIKDDRQFLLISRARERDIRAGNPENIFLIPELCRATGLTDRLRANFKLMQQVSNHTRLDPEKRVDTLKRFNNRIQSNEESIEVLNQWHLNLDRNLVTFDGRELSPEDIVFGGGICETANAKAEWAIKGKTSMYSAVDCTRWVFLYPRELEREALNFLNALIRAGEKMSYKITEPLHRAINDDRQESYIREIEAIGEKNPKIVVVALPTNRADRYSAVKRRCMVDYGIPCQVIVKNKTMCHRNLDSIATKIAIQMNCKLGGIPWMIKLPVKGLMTVGFDVSHHPRDRSRSVGALCATFDLNKSSLFYSTTMEYKDGNEMVAGLDKYLSQAIKEYKDTCGELPARIVMYRDGVGEGQIATVEHQEVNPILKTLTRIYSAEGKTPLFAYIVVNKRVNARFFKKSGTHRINPRPGTVIDTTVTLSERADFYLISQHVGQGTVAPTYYNIISNSTGLSTDKLQILTYKMCHLYYNWGGTTRLPCVSQNAKKLAFLTSQSLQGPVHEKLKKTLYFL